MTHISTQGHGQEDEHGRGVLFGLAVATALAAGIGLFFRTEKGHEVQADVAEKAKELAGRFQEKREDLQEKVTHIFGALSDELEEAYLEVKGKVLADIHSMKKGTELTQEKFEALVDKTVEQFSQKKEWSKDVAENLKSHLKQDWKKIKAQF